MRSVAPMLCGLVAVLSTLLAADAAQAAGPRRSADDALLGAMNAARAAHRAPPLHWSGGLARAARLHSGAMARTGVFTHGAFAARVGRFTRARAIGENLAWVPRCSRGSARRVVGMWLDSPAHRQVLLARSFHRVGVGIRLGRVGSSPACLVTADFSA
jgi:uncharacterized protein YkwD